MTDQGKLLGILLVGYVVYTTMKGNLAKWLEVLGLKGSP